jgi:hypothetical protein
MPIDMDEYKELLGIRRGLRKELGLISRQVVDIGTRLATEISGLKIGDSVESIKSGKLYCVISLQVDVEGRVVTTCEACERELSLTQIFLSTQIRKV